MNKSFFSNRVGPVIASIMTGETPNELIAQARGSEFEGAGAITVDLSRLKPEFRNVEALKGIVTSVNLPFMFYFYRNDVWKECETDESRQEILKLAARAGASVVDVMGDLFDPSPRENTRNPAAIEKQKKLIAEFHGLGASVVMSSHMSEALRSDEILAQLQDFKLRGADIAKIVTKTDSEEEFLESLRAIMRARRELGIPFIHLSNGAFGRAQRFFGESLGVSITFAIHRYDFRAPMIQPTVSAMKTVFENMHWHIDGF